MHFQFRFQRAPDAVFSTAVTSLKPEDAFDTNRVKCVVDNQGYAIYFSRGLIPSNKWDANTCLNSYINHILTSSFSNLSLLDQGKSILIIHIFFILESRYLFNLMLIVTVYICFMIFYGWACSLQHPAVDWLTDCFCIQGFDSKFLRIYPELPPTPLQLEEDLEQLKVLENGYRMKVIWHGTWGFMR